MAGGFPGKLSPKLQQALKNGFSSEVLKDSQGDQAVPKSENKSIFSLKGILNLGQTVEIGRNQDNLQKKSEKLFSSISHLEQEQKVLLEQQQNQLEKAINELRQEIKQLIKSSNQLEKQVEVAASSPIAEVNEYQLKFLDRIRQFIANFRQNIGDASIWLESFAKKKKKKNLFWTTAKDKKKGGEQYLFSNEHSSARSVN